MSRITWARSLRPVSSPSPTLLSLWAPTSFRGQFVCRQCRAKSIHIEAAAATETEKTRETLRRDLYEYGGLGSADARFEVLGSPYSILSVSLSASQRLYTRRGTLVSVAGDVENVQSTLSLLSPIPRALLGIPFLYQRIISTTPINALISTKSPNTTLSILHLDGTTDWIVANRSALLAWTGHTLTLTPCVQTGLTLAHWGNTRLTGRGLAALAAPGQVYEMKLSEGEELVLHPSHVVAYTVTKNPPLPFRFKSTMFTLTIPTLPPVVRTAAGKMIPEGWSRFWAAMRDTVTYKLLSRVFFSLRTAARTTIWGDRLFLQFKGPTTILMSSQGARVRDVLTREHVNEIAEVEPGAVQIAAELPVKESEEKQEMVRVRIARVGKEGKVTFEDVRDLNEFVR